MSLEKMAARQAKKYKRVLNRSSATLNQKSWARIKDALMAQHTDLISQTIIDAFTSDSKGICFRHELFDFWARARGFGDKVLIIRDIEFRIRQHQEHLKAIQNRVPMSPKDLEEAATVQESLNHETKLLKETEIVKAFDKIMSSIPQARAAIYPDNHQEQGEEPCPA